MQYICTEFFKYIQTFRQNIQKIFLLVDDKKKTQNVFNHKNQFYEEQKKKGCGQPKSYLVSKKYLNKEIYNFAQMYARDRPNMQHYAKSKLCNSFKFFHIFEEMKIFQYKLLFCPIGNTTPISHIGDSFLPSN